MSIIAEATDDTETGTVAESGSKERSLVKVVSRQTSSCLHLKQVLSTCSCAVSPISSFFPESISIFQHLKWAEQLPDTQVSDVIKCLTSQSLHFSCVNSKRNDLNKHSPCLTSREGPKGSMTSNSLRPERAVSFSLQKKT